MSVGRGLLGLAGRRLILQLHLIVGSDVVLVRFLRTAFISSPGRASLSSFKMLVRKLR